MFEEKTTIVQIPGVVVKTTTIMTPQQHVLDRIEQLRTDGRSISAQQDWETVVREDPKLATDYADYELARVIIAETASRRGPVIKLRELVQECRRVRNYENTPVVRKRTPRITSEECERRLGRPSLSQYRGRVLEQNIIRRLDTDRALAKHLGTRQLQIVELLRQGFEHQQIISKLGLSGVQEINSAIRQEHRLRKRLRARLQGYGHQSEPTTPRSADLWAAEEKPRRSKSNDSL